ncbi:Auxin response factor 6 [Striga hermonthica]|uniref:Auxin response factor 6 n=1 Tax=Striga hermonthica TaxID=68872 RepID=A0A9N7NSK7_STRHE|nr:Auxin response factor 6 [Striga hermonthica]
MPSNICEILTVPHNPYRPLHSALAVRVIKNENNQLLLGIRVQIDLKQLCLHLCCRVGLLAAAAHAAATSIPFTIFYDPRASPPEFVIPLAKYAKAVYHTRVSVGMLFRMLFETKESTVRRYISTITGINDLDPVRWSNSHWRSLKEGWLGRIDCRRKATESLIVGDRTSDNFSYVPFSIFPQIEAATDSWTPLIPWS